MKIALYQEIPNVSAIACNEKDSVTSLMYGKKLSNTPIEFIADE